MGMIDSDKGYYGIKKALLFVSFMDVSTRSVFRRGEDFRTTAGTSGVCWSRIAVALGLNRLAKYCDYFRDGALWDLFHRIVATGLWFEVSVWEVSVATCRLQEDSGFYRWNMLVGPGSLQLPYSLIPELLCV